MVKKELCVFCNGETEKKKVDVTRNWGGRISVFKSVHADVCKRCSEAYFSLQVMKEMESVLLKRTKPNSVLKVPVYVI